MPSVTTKTGDTGSTSLWGNKKVSKTDRKIEALGFGNSLNVELGALRLELKKYHLGEERRFIEKVQRLAISIMGDIANYPQAEESAITKSDLFNLEYEASSIEPQTLAMTPTNQRNIMGDTRPWPKGDDQQASYTAALPAVPCSNDPVFRLDDVGHHELRVCDGQNIAVYIIDKKRWDAVKAVLEID